MSVATSPCEAAAVPLDRGAGSVVPLRRPAVHGEAALSLRHLDGATRPADLYQRDPLSLRLPRPARGDILEACLITTSGGIVGGDRLDIAVTAGQGARARVYPQAAEKVYRSTGADSRIDVALTAEAGCWLEWLPQETILFDGARLRRRTTLDLAAGSRVLAGEFLVFGRRASGEQLARGLIHDAWRVSRDGTLVWADALHMDGDLAAPLTSPACLGGATAFASMIYAADDAASHLPALRDLLPAEAAEAQHALTAVNGLVVGRFIGEARAVRQSFGGFWAAARAALAGLPPYLPRLWQL
ncbi:urease accessory protein UreD [Pelagibius sp.]|uniref:urease accessory protein UreD n=1 Tax=Pelagibius sp. TaxID=1931238 RepID=UPI00263244C1|nr:urease accessory protein UreD [Pelagibius sp.]